jgi:hypothetical protein
MMVQGSTSQQSYYRLCSVLDRIRGKNLHLNKTKCQFFKQSVRYLGHEINAQGLHPLQEKVDAITSIQPSKDADQLHTFIGMVNYYHKFILNVSSILHSLHQLIRKDAQFLWTQNCDAAFVSIKADLASARVLVHYDPKLQLILAIQKGRSLTQKDANYIQIDKEATAIFWGLKKYFHYCYGRQFILLTVPDIDFQSSRELKIDA